MGLDRELANLRRRLNSIAPQVVPPTLKMHVTRESDPVPTPTAWEMSVYIESKKQTLPL